MTDWQHALSEDDVLGGMLSVHPDPFAMVRSKSLDDGYKVFSANGMQRDLSAEEVDEALLCQGIDPASDWQ
jgi:hypothetical protein